MPSQHVTVTAIITDNGITILNIADKFLEYFFCAFLSKMTSLNLNRISKVAQKLLTHGIKFKSI